MATMQEPFVAPSDRFGPFGGRYVPETLIPALDELTAAYEAINAEVQEAIRK